MTHYQQLQRFAQKDKWNKLLSDFDRGEPVSKAELLVTVQQVMDRAEEIKNFLKNRTTT